MRKHLRCRRLVAAAAILVAANSSADARTRPRARDHGVPFDGTPVR